MKETCPALPGQNIREVWRNKKIVLASGLAHLTHDGFADMLYVFFPIWQTQFGLTFALVGLFKMLFSGTLALLQVPSSYLARLVGPVRLLLLGTLVTSLAVIGFGWAEAALLLGLLLVIGGLGESVQHPLSSTLISDSFTDRETRRTALSFFNVSGDLGKLAFPPAAALLISQFGWPHACHVMGLFGVAVTLVLFLLAPSVWSAGDAAATQNIKTGNNSSIMRGNNAFTALLGIGILDSATRMGFLTFFPFLLRDKGADVALMGLTLSLVFGGGVAGKFVCGVLATRVGILRTVIITECLTAVCIWAALVLPLNPVLFLCPVLGLALNGTSSVLYGSVPELVPEDNRNKAFAVFYTATIGSGAVSPLIYGLAGDLIGLVPTVVGIGALVFAALPMTLALRDKLA